MKRFSVHWKPPYSPPIASAFVEAMTPREAAEKVHRDRHCDGPRMFTVIGLDDDHTTEIEVAGT